MRGERWAQFGALVAGLGLRAFFVAVHPRFQGDTLIYADLAHNMLIRHVYGLTEDGAVRATLIRLPGYPMFLALCFAIFGGVRYLPVLWVQVFVDLLGCWLLGRIATRLFGERVGLVCLWMAALCPFTANYSAAVLTETVSIFCVVVAFWGMVGWRASLRRDRPGLPWAGVVGAAWRGAVLLRPDGILLSGAMLPAMVWVARMSPRRNDRKDGRGGQRGAWEGVVIALGCVLVFLGAWTIRNWRVYHVFQPLAPKYANDPGEPAPVGFARWYRTWGAGLGDTARVYWEYDGSALSTRDLPPWAIDDDEQRAETESLYTRYNEETSSTPAVEAGFALLAQQRERDHPLRTFVAMPLARLDDMWIRPRTELLPKMPVRWWQPARRPRATLLACALGLLNLALLGAALRGLWRWKRAGWNGDGVAAAAMLGYVVLRSALLLMIDNSEPRYVLEGYPVVILLAALAVTRKQARAASLIGE